MGLFKKIKKAVSKAVKAPLKAVGKAVGVDAGQQQVQAPPPEQVQAPDVEPAKDVVDDTGAAETESDRRKSRAGGKRSLSVQRNSGAGINI